MKSHELNTAGLSRKIMRLIRELERAKADLESAKDGSDREWLREEVHDLTAKLAWELIEYGRFEEGYAFARMLPWRTHARDRCLSEGTSLLHLNRLPEAYALLATGAQNYPDFAPILVGLANCYLRRNEHEKALECTERALKLDPRDYKIQFNKAVDLHNLGFYEDARAILLKILKRKPKEQRSHSLLGHCCVQMGHPEDAQKHFQAAMAFGYRFADVYEGLFLAYYNQGMRSDAINTALQGIRMYPGQEPDLYMNLAATYHEMGWTAEAIDVIQKAIAAFPENDELKEWLKELEDGPDGPEDGEEIGKPKILLILDQKKNGRLLP